MGKRKRRRQTKAEEPRFVRPTDEQMAHNRFTSAGAAVRRVDPIETLKRAEKITQRQFDALGRYADIANKAERSPVKSGIDFSVSDGGEGLPHFGVRMNRELDWMNAILGALQPIAHAICVKGLTPSGYAMRETRAVERIRNGVFVYEPPRRALEDAMRDIAAAGDRLADALDTGYGKCYAAR